VEIEEMQLRFSLGNGTEQLMEAAVVVDAVPREASGWVAKPFELARLGPEQTGGAQEKGGFPCARSPNETDRLAGAKLQIDTAQHLG
jgi:hypothetical protein